MIADTLGAEFRRFEERDHEGQPVRVVIAERVYPTDPSDLWDAVTNAERLSRWFSPVSGDLKLGGRYQIQGNAEGTITGCEPPHALDLTWEFGGSISWVKVRLASEGDGTRLALEHIAPIGIMEEHWNSFGPSAVGVGWDLSLLGLSLHVGSDAAIDHEQFERWSASADGKVFLRQSAAAWAQAHIAGSADPQLAQAMAERTAKAYSGEC